VNNSNPELRNIDPLLLQVSSNDTGLVIEPTVLNLLISNPIKCGSITFTMDTMSCDAKNVTVVVESVDDNENLEYHIVYNNQSLTLQIMKCMRICTDKIFALLWYYNNIISLCSF
jgi:hypothetical protein